MADNPRIAHAVKHARKRAGELALIVGHVYIIQCGEYYKIGHAYDVRYRLRDLQKANPHTLSLVCAFPFMSPLTAEQGMHAELHKYHHRGEWFKLPAEALTLAIERLRFRSENQ